MRRFRTIAATSAFALALTALAAAPASAFTTGTSGESGEQEYVVLFTAGTSSAAAKAAVTAAGGTIVSENTDVGVATVRTTDAGFEAQALAQGAIEGTAQNRIIADVPDDAVSGEEAKKIDEAEAETRAGGGATPAAPAAAAKGKGAALTAEPLAPLQWDMQQIGATVDGSYKVEPGSKKVLVGILDTGVDGTHPDIAPNFDNAKSRNFTVDIPYDANGDVIDGPCEDEADGSCTDAANVDEDGHGTHVASTIGSPINGIGIAGVAPNVTLVNLRAGQDSGYFFLQPSIDALTYAGKIGVDVVNMSYYLDPWLFNCASNPADSLEDQQEQQTIVKAMQRALDYARVRGVTLVSAAGNGATDYTKVLSDSSSPDFADVEGEVAYPRDLLDPATCISMPSEGKGVISVSSTGVSKRKAYYSDYGNGYIDVAAPGGDVYDTPTNTRDIGKAILAAYPKALALESGAIDEAGNVLVDGVVKSCDAAGTTCGYYQYLQGTSMASPHATGVAALIVSKYGIPDVIRGGKYLPAAIVDARLRQTAVDTACPTPAAFTYTRITPAGATITATHTCEGNLKQNGFYGNGIISALKAVGK
ncbi:S8 family peptidase [Agromyces aureus]|uniref:Peptidase S8 n=1 Tax=Agromyces aureus TaxID=453304 RepID=A0A191WII4_9MICO|nr:S8 family serine peptidase [Agromyces aureus]ANJ28125.1 peptidase S8 [Agromyces aureus]